MLNTKKQPQLLDKQNTFVNDVPDRRTSLFLHDEDNYSFVAALEIGTSYSGYAYSPRKDGKSVAKDIGKSFLNISNMNIYFWCHIIDITTIVGLLV